MKKALFILFAALIFVACKKEDRIEKNLWKQGGEWNIETWEESQTSYDYPQVNSSDIKYNVGTFNFNKDGSGSLIISDGFNAYTEPFTYKVSKYDLTIFDDDGVGKVYKLDWKRNEFTASSNTLGSSSFEEDEYTTVTVMTEDKIEIKCKKK